MPGLVGKFNPAYTPFSSAGKQVVEAVRSMSDMRDTPASASAALSIAHTLRLAALPCLVRPPTLSRNVAGTSRGPSRCACTNSVALASSRLQEGKPYPPQTAAFSSAASVFVPTPATAGNRTEANNILPHSGLGHDQTIQHAQVTVISLLKQHSVRQPILFCQAFGVSSLIRVMGTSRTLLSATIGLQQPSVHLKSPSSAPQL